jgi:hypothetical protein
MQIVRRCVMTGTWNCLLINSILVVLGGMAAAQLL